MKWAVIQAFVCLITITALNAQEIQDSVRYQLPPVTVTATRITESWIEAPLAISVIEINKLPVVKGFGLDEALMNVPGVMAQSRSGSQDVRLMIRGFGARGAGERSNAGTSRGIRILLDGFPETEPDGRTSFDLIDLSTARRIEIIRSNASSLWGNAAGGVINIITIPTGEKPSLSVSSSFGSFGYRKEFLGLLTSVGEGKLSLSSTNINFDGWRDHSRSTRSLFNATISSPIGTTTRLDVAVAAASSLFNIPGPLTQKQFEENPGQAQNDTSNYLPTYVQRDERRFNRLGRIGITLTHELNARQGISASIFTTPKYLQRSERNTYRDFNRYHIGGNLIYRHRISVGNGLENIILAGMDEAYQDGAILFYTLDNGQRGDLLTTNKREGANNFGAFLQDECIIKEKLSLVGGLRYDNITYYSENYLEPALKASKSFTRVTPKFGVTYRLTPTHSIYGNIGGGVEVPAGNETDPPSTFGEDTITSLSPLLEPITSTTIELGTKRIFVFNSSIILKSLIYDAAFYFIQVRNDIVPYRGGRFYFTAGKTERLGSEVSCEAVTQFGLTLHTSLTYSYNRYREYLIDSVHYKNPGKFTDFSSNEMAGVPEFFYRIVLKYVPQFVRTLSAEVSFQGVSEYYADDGNTIKVPPYSITNLAVGIQGLQIIGDRLSLSALVGVNNVFNRKYIASAFINPDLDRGKMYPIFAEPGLPRNYAGSLSLSWQL